MTQERTASRTVLVEADHKASEHVVGSCRQDTPFYRLLRELEERHELDLAELRHELSMHRKFNEHNAVQADFSRWRIRQLSLAESSRCSMQTPAEGCTTSGVSPPISPSHKRVSIESRASSEFRPMSGTIQSRPQPDPPEDNGFKPMVAGFMSPSVASPSAPASSTTDVVCLDDYIAAEVRGRGGSVMSVSGDGSRRYASDGGSMESSFERQRSSGIGLETLAAASPAKKALDKEPDVKRVTSAGSRSVSVSKTMSEKHRLASIGIGNASGFRRSRSEEMYVLKDWWLEDDMRTATSYIAHQRAAFAETGRFTSEASDATVDSRTTSVERSKKKWTPIMNPTSRKRMIWEMLGFITLASDLFWIPLQAFNIEESWFTILLTWGPMVYWTFDIPASFLVGHYTTEGQLNLDMKAIARGYLKGWFACDIMLVLNDWLALAFFYIGKDVDSDSVGLARLVKSVRLARILRTLRLLRLAKIREFVIIVQQYIDSEYLTLVFGMGLNVVSLISLNHVIACLWFSVGVHTEDEDGSWVKEKGVDQWSVFPQYTISLHWSLTQFTPASMEVFPENKTERAFTVVVILFAMLTFSSFLSSITSAMTRLRTLKANRVAQQYDLRRFLNENHISRDLSTRITRYIAVLAVHSRRAIDTNKVELLHTLTGPLRVSLQKELFSPLLRAHDFFCRYEAVAADAMSQLCCALKSVFFSRSDSIFNIGCEASHMYILSAGSIRYRAPMGVEQEHLSTIIDRRGECLSEAVLWTPWVHAGTAKAVIETNVATLDAEDFAMITRRFPDAYAIARSHAETFLRRLLDSLEILDVQNFENCVEAHYPRLSR